MPGDSEFFPPVQFSPGWALLALVIVLLIVAWFVVVPLATRARQPVVVAQAAPPDFTALRSQYIARISEVEESYERFELPAREAHQRLSALIRAFAHESTTHPASAMTLSELRQAGLPQLTGAVERLYPAEFGPEERGNLSAAAAEARKVVLEWP